MQKAAARGEGRVVECGTDRLLPRALHQGGVVAHLVRVRVRVRVRIRVRVRVRVRLRLLTLTLTLTLILTLTLTLTLTGEVECVRGDAHQRLLVPPG